MHYILIPNDKQHLFISHLTGHNISQYFVKITDNFTNGN